MVTTSVDRLTSIDNSRQLSIARRFVLQYYTFLNKAPNLAHRFYSHDSTLIHGTLEKPGEKKAEPSVGLEKIQEKIKELKLNDCRVKIKQIDSLETLSRGLVIQVIGELSNAGAPMRRFLQTFVLAPGPVESSRQNSRNDNAAASMTQISTSSTSTNINNDQHHQHNHSSQIHASNSALSSEASSLSGDQANEKYYVLNNIFRYQDDGLDDDEISSSNINTSIDNPNHISSSTTSSATSTSTTSIANSSDIVKHQQQNKHQQLQHKQQITPVPSNVTTANQHKHMMTLSDTNETSASTQVQLGPPHRPHQQQSFNAGTNLSSPRQRPDPHHHESHHQIASSRNNTFENIRENKKQSSDATEMIASKQQVSNATHQGHLDKLKLSPQAQPTSAQNYLTSGTTTSNQKILHEESKYTKEHQRLTTHGPSDDKPASSSDSYVNSKLTVSSVAASNTKKPQESSAAMKGGAVENKDALNEQVVNVKKDVHSNINGSVDDAEHSNQQNFQLAFASSNEPKTWANMVSKNANAPQQVQAQTQQHLGSGQQTNKQPLTNQTQQFTNQQQAPQSNTQQQTDKGNRQNRQNRKQELRDGPTPPAPNSHLDDRAHDPGNSADFRNKEKYPDDHQVFVGGLTPEISEDDLREGFKSFGNIQAVRLSKGNASKSGKPTPDFGFIVFDNPAIVQTILQKKVMMLKNQRLNVEPKRSQAKSQSGYNNFGSRAKPSSYASRGSREHKTSSQQQQPQPQPKTTKNTPGI